MVVLNGPDRRIGKGKMSVLVENGTSPTGMLVGPRIINVLFGAVLFLAT